MRGVHGGTKAPPYGVDAYKVRGVLKFRVMILPFGKSYEMLRIVMNLPLADVMI